MRHIAPTSPARIRRHFALATASAVALTLAASPLTAQSFRTDFLHPEGRQEISIEASSNDIVQVLAGIGEIRAAVQLGLLFLEEGLKNPEGSHFLTPRAHIYPGIKDSLAAVGAPDLEPLLQALEAASGKEEVTAAFSAVEGALQQAHSKLNPTSADQILAVMAMAQAAAGKINAAGPTPVADYQDAWAIIMAARSDLDLLMRDPDPTIAKLAGDEAMLFDELIISIPDPHQMAPVEIDAGLFNGLVSQMEKMQDSA
jgi:hypothetical protein